MVPSAASSATSVFPSAYGQQLAMFKIVMALALQAEQNYLVGLRGEAEIKTDPGSVILSLTAVHLA